MPVRSLRSFTDISRGAKAIFEKKFFPPMGHYFLEFEFSMENVSKVVINIRRTIIRNDPLSITGTSTSSVLTMFSTSLWNINNIANKI